MTSETTYTTIHFLLNLQMGLISQSVISHKDVKAFQVQTLLLIWPIDNLLGTYSVVDTTSDTAFTTDHFFLTH
jgi:hypothetical protein